MSNKDQVQSEAVQKWIKKDRVGTIVLPTGSGKTRVGILCAKKVIESNPAAKVLIIVPTTNLRDKEWKNEIRRWAPEIEESVTIECVKTAYNKDYGTHFDLMVCDEIHTTLSPKYRAIYTDVKYNYIVGLTATPPAKEEYLPILKKFCPIIHRVTINQAVDLELVSKFKVYNVPVKLNRSERGKYTLFTRWMTSGRNKLQRAAKREGMNVFDVATEYRVKKYKGTPEYKAANDFWRGMSMRRWICYRASKKLDVTVDLITSNPDRKWIIFCHDTKIADTINDLLLNEGILSVAYHSKQKNEVREQALQTIQNPFCRVIVSAQALTTGYNLPKLDAGIAFSSTSTELTAVQELGRSIRRDVNKKLPIFINLFAQNTQEESWVEKKTQTLDPELIMDYRKIEF